MSTLESAWRTVSGTKLITHLRTPLYRNGYALLFSSAATSILGIVYWVLAARYYPTEVVGLSSAAISAMMFLSAVSRLNLNGAFIRFIPSTGRATRRFVRYSYLVSLVLAFVLGVIACVGIGPWSPVQKLLGSNPLLLLCFVLATMCWNIFVLQDHVLAGLRQTMWVPIENVLFSIGKIVLLLVSMRLFHQYGILISWVIPAVLSIAPITYLIFRRLIPQHMVTMVEQTEPIAPKQMITYVAGDYVGALFSLASTMLLPILVTYIAGASANAYFYLPWTIVGSLQLVATNMTTSLTVEAAIERARLPIYSYRVFVQIARIMIPTIAVLLVAAQVVLLVFGKNYAAEGATLLRLLTLSTIPNVITVLYISLARVRRQIVGIVIVQATLCISTLGLSYALLPVYGIVGTGVAYLVGQSAVAAVLLLTGNVSVTRPQETL